MLVVSLIAFVMFKFVGDPVAQLAGTDTSLEDRAALAERLGLNDPVLVQYARYVGDVARGEFGISFRTNRPVGAEISSRLPATLELAIVAAIYALLVGVPMGVYTGLYPDRWLSRAFQAVSLMGISLPDVLHRHPADPGVRRAARPGCPPSAAARPFRSAGGPRACSPSAASRP